MPLHKVESAGHLTRMNPSTGSWLNYWEISGSPCHQHLCKSSATISVLAPIQANTADVEFLKRQASVSPLSAGTPCDRQPKIFVLSVTYCLKGSFLCFNGLCDQQIKESRFEENNSICALDVPDSIPSDKSVQTSVSLPETLEHHLLY